MPVHYIFASLLLFLTTGNALAAEVDQFSSNRQELNDSREILNKEVNLLLADSIDWANRSRLALGPNKSRRRITPKCDADRLYQALTLSLARPFLGQLEYFAQTDPSISRRSVTLEQSIYKNFSWQQSPSLVISKRLAAVIRIGDVELGTDKLGHFLTEGWSYFEIASQSDSDLNDALLFGEWSEGLYYGAMTTGIFSYSDLVANFNGYRFWNSILATQPDPLSNKKPEPYVRCNNQKWELTKDFDWQPYIDIAWDESHNCSLYRDEMLLNKISQSCQSKEISPLKQKYSHFAERLINHKGNQLLPKKLQPENVLSQRYTSMPQWLKTRLKTYREQLEEWRNNRVH